MPFFRKKAPVILQLSDTECGIASLAMIFAYYQVNLPIEILREQCGVSRDGCKAGTLIEIARKYHFKADAYKVDIDEIRALRAPIIAYWNFNHYIVINGIVGNQVFINDPAEGSMVADIKDFDKSFTGVILDISPTRKVIKVHQKNSLLQIIKQWYTGFYRELFFLFLCLILGIAAAYYHSVLYNIFIDHCVIAKKKAWIPYMIAFSLFTLFVLINAKLLEKIMQFKLQIKASIVKSSVIMHHVLQLPMLFYSLRQRNEIISILSRAEALIHSLFKHSLNVMVGIIFAIFCFLLMIKLDDVLSWISGGISTLSIIAFFIFSKINLSYEKSNVNSVGKLYAHSLSTMRNLETIKACGLENETLKRWQGFFLKKIMIQDKINTMTIIMASIGKLTNNLLILSLICIGGYRAFHHHLSVGNLLGFYSLQLLFYSQVISIAQALKESQHAGVLHTRIKDILQYEKDTRYKINHVNGDENFKDNEFIRCSDIRFHYNVNAPPVLNHITLSIKQGQHIALVGNTGSGKSSLAKLLSALYLPQAGEILLLGKPLSTYSAPQLASLCAYVSQDISLFSGSILQNLTLWQETINWEDIHDAIDTACLNQLIAERGLHGKVEEAGRNFSGGERQRIDIARALIQNTPLLILDEASSALDEQTEMQLIKKLRTKNKTIIFVAHRLSSIMHCDQIFVLHRGEIIESGDHFTLLKKKCHYYTLVQNEKRLRER